MASTTLTISFLFFLHLLPPAPATSLPPSLLLRRRFTLPIEARPFVPGLVGASGDICLPEANSTICIPPRTCVNVSFQNCTQSDVESPDGCLCWADKPSPCRTSADCLRGDRCVKPNTEGFPSQVCISCNWHFHDENDTFVPVDDALLQCATPADPPPNLGYSGEDCTADNPNYCVSPRDCITIELGLRCSSSTNCVCGPSGDEYINCASSSQCPAGERCLGNAQFAARLCLSCLLPGFNMRGFFPIDTVTTSQCPTRLSLPALSPTPSASPSPSPLSEAQRGASFQPCSNTTTDLCTPPRNCLSQDATANCAAANCLCLPPQGPTACSSTSDCLPLDRCVSFQSETQCAACDLQIVNGTSVTPINNSSSICKPVPTPSLTATVSPIASSANTSLPLPEDPAPCIAIDTLQSSGLSSNSWVFPTHRQATVLCDRPWRNCATPAHIVVYEKRPMSMRLYCSLLQAGCTRRIALVNSPVMRWGLRVPAKGGRLQFTALAARYGSAVEESLLGILVRLGA